jgi:hypothetical protein
MTENQFVRHDQLPRLDFASCFSKHQVPFHPEAELGNGKHSPRIDRIDEEHLERKSLSRNIVQNQLAVLGLE